MKSKYQPVPVSEPLPTPAVQVVPWEQHVLVLARLDALEKQVAELIRSQPEYVDTKEALRITGLKHGQSLKALRNRPGTLVIVKFEGKNNQIPRYLRASLLAHNNSKVCGPYRSGISLRPL